MKYIDLENWDRKEHFNFFYRMDYPQFNICMNLDITGFLAFTKENHLSFYFAMIHAVTRIVNEMEAFRYRIRDDKTVVLHDRVHPSFTYLKDPAKNDLFQMITVDYTDAIGEFERNAREVSQNQVDYFGIDKLTGRDDLIYITSIPWISFTHLSHTISINRNDSVPRLSWGKFFREGDKTLLPFSVQVHHALMDGYQVGKYVERLQDYLNDQS